MRSYQEAALWDLVRLGWVLWLRQDGSWLHFSLRLVRVPVSEVGERSAGPSLLPILGKLQTMLSFEHLVDSPGVSTVRLLPVAKTGCR